MTQGYRFPLLVLRLALRSAVLDMADWTAACLSDSHSSAGTIHSRHDGWHSTQQPITPAQRYRDFGGSRAPLLSGLKALFPRVSDRGGFFLT